MGGGSKLKQTNPAQAAAAMSGATGAAGQASDLSKLYSGQQQMLFNLLWGNPTSTAPPMAGGEGPMRLRGEGPGMSFRGGPAGGPTTGGGGALRGFLDPNKLNVSSPTGPFALQFTKTKEQLAKGYQDELAATKRNLAQSGFGPNAPSGFGADLQARNARALASDVGSAYTDATAKAYQDALANFWKTAEMAQGGSQAAGAGALQGSGTAGQIYGNLYGTAGHGNVVPSSNVLGNLIGAGGTIGAAAMCVAEETRIRLNEHVVAKAGDLRFGDQVLGVEGRIRIVMTPEHSEQDAVRLTLESGAELCCSLPHTLLRPGGGYVRARDALYQDVLTYEGKSRVIDVLPVGKIRVVKLELDGSHTYLSGGIWSEE